MNTDGRRFRWSDLMRQRRLPCIKLTSNPNSGRGSSASWLKSRRPKGGHGLIKSENEIRVAEVDSRNRKEKGRDSYWQVSCFTKEEVMC